MANSAGAEADFDKAIALDPDYFLSYAYRGGIREDSGRDELALADYRKVLELYPDYWYAYESAGAAAFRLGLWSESAIDFKRAYDRAPDRYEYAIAAALALWRSGKGKEASSFAGKVAPLIDRRQERNLLEHAPPHTGPERFLGRARGQDTVRKEARPQVRDALLLYPSIGSAEARPSWPTNTSSSQRT